jgi:hypothetical protein
LFALWVPLGPCASLASAWLAVQPCCQANKIGCHGGDCAKKAEQAKRGCSCHSRTELKSGLCSCGHDSAGLVLNADPTRLPATFALAPESAEIPVPLPSFRLDGTREGPDIPPPIVSVSFS